MSSYNPSHTHYSGRLRDAAGLGQAGRYRINIQIGLEQLHTTILLPETRSFNYIMDELQPMFGLSGYQRIHTRIFLQTILGETEVLVNARPNYLTERNVDYVGIPINPLRPTIVQRRTRLWFCLMLFFFLTSLALATFLAADLLVVRPRLVQEARKSAKHTIDAPAATTPLLSFLPPIFNTSIGASLVSAPSPESALIAGITLPVDSMQAAKNQPLPPSIIPSVSPTPMSPLITTTGLLATQPKQNRTLATLTPIQQSKV